MTKKEALQIVFSCAASYKENLAGRSLLFVTTDKHKTVRCLEVTFDGSNFLHMTGFKLNKKEIIEMQGERLADRWLLSAGDINPYRWRTGIPNPHEVAEAHTTAAELARLPIHVDDSTSTSMDHVRSSARLLKSKGTCDLIIIDYLQLCDMSTGQKNRNREQEVAQATRKAKLIAKELNVPVVLLCQLNRESEGRPGGRPELFHLRESGAIEQDADVVMLLYRPALARITTDRESGYPTEGLGVVIVAKQRNGETGNAYFSHNPSLTKITDYTPPLEVLLKQAK